MIAKLIFDVLFSTKGWSEKSKIKKILIAKTKVCFVLKIVK